MLMLLGVPPLWGLQSQYSGRKWRFLIHENILQTVSYMAIVRKLHTIDSL